MSEGIKVRKAATANSNLIQFYLGKIRNPTSGLGFDEMLASKDLLFIGTHNWITWLFPSKKRSCSLDSIVATKAELAAFQTDAVLRRKLLLALQRVLALYGFALEPSGTIVLAADYETRKNNWLKNSPNQKRIARILQSLMLVGMSEIARKWVEVLPMDIPEMSDYWQASVSDPAVWSVGGRYGNTGGW